MAQRKTSEQRLSELEKKQSQIHARIKKEKAKQRIAERKIDTRRKIIAGALALEHMQHDATHATTMTRLLNRGIEREEDKALFADLLQAETEISESE